MWHRECLPLSQSHRAAVTSARECGRECHTSSDMNCQLKHSSIIYFVRNRLFHFIPQVLSPALYLGVIPESTNGGGVWGGAVALAERSFDAKLVDYGQIRMCGEHHLQLSGVSADMAKGWSPSSAPIIHLQLERRQFPPVDPNPRKTMTPLSRPRARANVFPSSSSPSSHP